MNATALITTHLKAPFGELLCAQDLADSLRVGRLSAKSEQANANQLYPDTLDHQAPRSPQWEQAVAGQL